MYTRTYVGEWIHQRGIRKAHMENILSTVPCLSNGLLILLIPLFPISFYACYFLNLLFFLTLLSTSFFLSLSFSTSPSFSSNDFLLPRLSSVPPLIYKRICHHTLSLSLCRHFFSNVCCYFKLLNFTYNRGSNFSSSFFD